MDEDDDPDLVGLLQSLVDPPDFPSASFVPSLGFQQERTVGSSAVIGTGTAPEGSMLSEYLSDGIAGEVWKGFLPSGNGESSNGRIPADSSPIDGDERLPSMFTDSQFGAIGGLVARDVEENKENRETGEELDAGFLRCLPDHQPNSSVPIDLEVVGGLMDSPEKETRCVLSVKDEGDSIKKRKRQLRNRDSAVRSRERKKTYVKDLEMKSRFLQFECRRLEKALALCCAENHALRARALSLEASTARQESAVLRTESLLLGSLLWLAALVWGVVLPLLARPSAEGGVGGEKKKGTASAPAAPTKRVINERLFGFRLVLLKRRCRSVRKKMKEFRDLAVRQCILGLGFLAPFVSFCFLMLVEVLENKRGKRSRNRSCKLLDPYVTFSRAV